MQKSNLFAENNEESVDKLRKFAHDKQKGPEASDTISIADVAHRVDNSTSENGINELRPGANAASDAEAGQQEIPEEQGLSQLESRPRAHVEAADDDEHDVEGGEDERELPVGLHPRVKRVYLLARLEQPLEAELDRVVRRHVRVERVIDGGELE